MVSGSHLGSGLQRAFEKRFQSLPWAWGTRPGTSAGRWAHIQSTAIEIHTNPQWWQKGYRGLWRSWESKPGASWLPWLPREPHTQGRVSPSMGTHSRWRWLSFPSCELCGPHETLTEPSDSNGSDSRFSFTERVTVHSTAFFFFNSFSIFSFFSPFFPCLLWP